MSTQYQSKISKINESDMIPACQRDTLQEIQYAEQHYQNVANEKVLSEISYQSIKTNDDQNNQQFQERKSMSSDQKDSFLAESNTEGITETNNMSILNSSITSKDPIQKAPKQVAEVDPNQIFAFFFNNDLIEYKYKEALKLAFKFQEDQKKNNTQKSFQNIENLFKIGKIFLQTSQYQNSLEYLLKAQQYVKQKFPQNNFFIAGLLNVFSMTYQWLSQYDLAKEKLKQAQQHIKKLKGKQLKQKTAQNYSVYGMIGNVWKQTQSEKKERLQYIQNAMKIYKQLDNGSDYNKQCYKCHNNLASIYFYSNNLQKAAKHLQECLRIAQQIYKGNDRKKAQILSHCGTVYAKFRKFDKAQKFLDQAKQIYQAIKLEDMVQNVVLTFNYCILQENKGNIQQALSLCQNSMVLLKKLVNKQNELMIQAKLKEQELIKKLEKQKEKNSFNQNLNVSENSQQMSKINSSLQEITSSMSLSSETIELHSQKEEQSNL